MKCKNNGCEEKVFTVYRTFKNVRTPQNYTQCHAHWRQNLLKKRDVKRYKNVHGYMYVRNKIGNWTAEHRLIMEDKLGRGLVRGESVHHINGIRDDNRPKNLELWVGAIRYGQRASEVICRHCNKPYL